MCDCPLELRSISGTAERGRPCRKPGLAWLEACEQELGTELEVETPRERTSAVIVEKPFIDPKKETPKQELAGTAGGQD